MGGTEIRLKIRKSDKIFEKQRKIEIRKRILSVEEKIINNKLN